MNEENTTTLLKGVIMKTLITLFLFVSIACGQIPDMDNTNSSIEEGMAKENNESSTNTQLQEVILPNHKYYLGKDDQKNDCFVIKDNLIECYDNKGEVKNKYESRAEKGDRGDDGQGCEVVEDILKCGTSEFDLAKLSKKGDKGETGDSCNINNNNLTCSDTNFDLTTLKGSNGVGIDGNDGSNGQNGDSCAVSGNDLICGETTFDLNTLIGATGSSGSVGAQGIQGNQGDQGTSGVAGTHAGQRMLINGVEFVSNQIDTTGVNALHVVHIATEYQAIVTFQGTTGPYFGAQTGNWGDDRQSGYGLLYSDSDCTSLLGRWNFNYTFYNYGKGVLRVVDDNTQIWVGNSTFSDSYQYTWNDANTNGTIDAGECSQVSMHGWYAYFSLQTMPEEDGIKVFDVIVTMEIQ